MLQHVQFLHGQQYFPSRKVELGGELIKRCYDELPAGYSKLFAIDLQRDKKPALIVNVLALVIAAVMAAVGAFLVPFGSALREAGMITALILLLSIVAYMLLHELVHGICMRLFGSGKVKYGFTGMYAFAGSGSYFAKGPYIVIALAPVVVLGAVLLGLNLYFSGGAAFWVVYIVQICNVGGAAGDIYVTFRFMRLPKDILVQDSGVAMTVYAK